MFSAGVRWSAFFAVVLPSAAVPAQAPDTQAAGLLATVRLADPPYVDASFGFSLQPFSDADILRQKRPTDDGDIELVQFFHYRLNWAMTVSLARTEGITTPDARLARLEEKLLAQHKDARIARRDTPVIAGFDAARISALAAVTGVEWFLQQAIIAVRPAESFRIVFNTPAAHRSVAEPLFDEMLASFKMLRSEMTQELLGAGLERGTNLLRSLADQRSVSRNLVEEQYLRFLAEGRDVGYLWLRELRTTQNRREGVGLHQEGWLFDPDGTVKVQINDAFLADDLAYERWENRVQVLRPAAGQSPVQLLVTLEQAVREKDRLLVAFTKAANDPKLEDKSIVVSASFAPFALFTLFPRLVDLARPELYVFSAYNSERRGLVMRALRVAGPQNILVDGRSVRVTRIEDSEGLIPPVNEMYVDAQGRLARVVAGNVEMIQTSRDKIRSMYGERMAQAQRTFQQLMQAARPAPRPGAPAVPPPRQ